MKTKQFDANTPGATEEAAALLRKGGLIAFPTDTLYGLGAYAFNQAAIEQLYKIKNRPKEKGIPILLADLDDLASVVNEVPAEARLLIDRLWPGALTLILPKGEDLPAIISPNNGVAVRIPDNTVARRFIRAAGGAIATSSANFSGEEPALDGKGVYERFKGLIAAILDDGPVLGGSASTILDCTFSPPQLIRKGPISADNLKLVAANES